MKANSTGSNRNWFDATSVAEIADAADVAIGSFYNYFDTKDELLAALLQDIGMLALDKAVPDLYRGGETLQRDHKALAEVERKRLQTDHAEIGGWLMRTWNLPERLHIAWISPRSTRSRRPRRTRPRCPPA